MERKVLSLYMVKFLNVELGGFTEQILQGTIIRFLLYITENRVPIEHEGDDRLLCSGVSNEGVCQISKPDS